VLLSIRDDGVGGADPTRGSGLVGLLDRVEALGGTIDIESARGGGPSVVVTLPLDTLPLDTLPVDTLPVDTLPVDTLPVDTLPVDAEPMQG
jgi:hypothetical protein